MMMLKALVVLVAVFAGAAVGQETQDVKRHGACVVWTETDPMSDEVGAWVVCATQPEAETMFVLGRAVDSPNMTVGFHSEEAKYVADNTPLDDLISFTPSAIRFRVDQGDILTSSGKLGRDGFFYIEDGTLAEALLDQISKGEKLHCAIENFRTYTLDLDGAKDAVADLRERLQAAGR